MSEITDKLRQEAGFWSSAQGACEVSLELQLGTGSLFGEAADYIDRLEAALTKISSPTQSTGLLWWQPSTQPPEPMMADDIVTLLRGLVFLDEVGSDNPLGRDAATEIETLRARVAVLEGRGNDLLGALRKYGFPPSDAAVRAMVDGGSIEAQAVHVAAVQFKAALTPVAETPNQEPAP